MDHRWQEAFNASSLKKKAEQARAYHACQGAASKSIGESFFDTWS